MDSPKTPVGLYYSTFILTLIIADVLIAVLFDPPHMYLRHVCTNKVRKNIPLFKVSLQTEYSTVLIFSAYPSTFYWYFL